MSDSDDFGIRVTVTDLATGETETHELWNDYVLITAGSCELANVQSYPGTGTHMLTIKGARPRPTKVTRKD